MEELNSKVNTDQPMREAEQSLVAKVNALIDAYFDAENSVKYGFQNVSKKIFNLNNNILALQDDMKAVKSKLGM